MVVYIRSFDCSSYCIRHNFIGVYFKNTANRQPDSHARTGKPSFICFKTLILSKLYPRLIRYLLLRKSQHFSSVTKNTSIGLHGKISRYIGFWRLYWNKICHNVTLLIYDHTVINIVYDILVVLSRCYTKKFFKKISITP